MMTASELYQKIVSQFASKIESHSDFRDDLSLTVAASDLLPIVTWLKQSKELNFSYLTDLTGLDNLKLPVTADKTSARFTVIYHLFSPTLNLYLRLKVTAVESAHEVLPEVPSLSGLWKSALWLEREVYDMLGIRFVGHPNLKRILMTDEMVGYPLRKDFPLHGPPEWPLDDHRLKRRGGPHGQS